MKRPRPIAMILALFLTLSVCGARTAVETPAVLTAESAAISAEPSEAAQLSQAAAPASPHPEGETAMDQIILSFNGHSYTATLADNPSAKAFTKLLKDGPLTISTHDYGSFEKVGSLGRSLPRSDEQITTNPGDIILYQGNQITVYYAQNTWNFTRLGRINDPSGLREALGSGDVEITFQLASSEPLPYDGIYPQHEPYGTGIGAMPGRVVWVHDPDCVEWDGRKTFERVGMRCSRPITTVGVREADTLPGRRLPSRPTSTAPPSWMTTPPAKQR